MMSVQQLDASSSEEEQKKLYAGSWTQEEEEYTDALIHAFRAGILPHVQEGATLRNFLAEAVGCHPKRISKKYEGTEYNGRQQFWQNIQPMAQEEALEHLNRIEELKESFKVSRQERIARAGKRKKKRLHPSLLSQCQKTKDATKATPKQELKEAFILPTATPQTLVPVSQAAVTGRTTTAKVASPRPVGFRHLQAHVGETSPRNKADLDMLISNSCASGQLHPTLASPGASLPSSRISQVLHVSGLGRGVFPPPQQGQSVPSASAGQHNELLRRLASLSSGSAGIQPASGSPLPSSRLHSLLTTGQPIINAEIERALALSSFTTEGGILASLARAPRVGAPARGSSQQVTAQMLETARKAADLERRKREIYASLGGSDGGGSQSEAKRPRRDP